MYPNPMTVRELEAYLATVKNKDAIVKVTDRNCNHSFAYIDTTNISSQQVLVNSFTLD